MSISLFALSGAFIAVSSGVMAFVMFVFGRNRLHVLWGFFCISVLVWGIGGYFIGTTQDPAQAFFWWKVTHVGIALIPVLFLHFVYVFLKKKGEMFVWLLYAVACIFAVTLFSSDLLVAHVRLVFGTFYYDSPPGLLYPLFTLYFFGLTLWSHFLLYQGYHAGILQLDETDRNRIKYFFLGMLISFAGGSFSFLPVYGIDIYPVTNFAVTLYPIIIGYAILRHQLFNIKAATAQGLVFLLWMFIGVRFLVSQSKEDFIVNGALFVGVVVLGIFLIRSIGKEISARELIETQEKELEKTNAQLRELDKQKSEFLSFASHQLRTPLTAIKWSAAAMKDGTFGAIPEPLREPIQTIFEESALMALFINDYLNVSRIEQGSMEYRFVPTDLGLVLRSAVSELEAGIKAKGLTITLEVGEERTMVWADPSKLTQVFTNLIDNALKYTPQGGIGISLHKKDGKAHVEIKDTGIGMDHDTLKKVFDKFVRGENAKQVNNAGSGLGLFIVKTFVQVHKGSIQIESEGLGKGTMFILEFPLLIHTQSAPPAAARRGFSLIEVLVAASIFLILGVGLYTIGTGAVRGVRIYRQTAVVATLADKYMEIARNLPYSKVGTLNGNPAGPLPDLLNAASVAYDNATYQVYYVVTYVSDSSDTVPQNDYKQVKLYIKDPVSGRTTSFVTTITPKGLTSASGGALSLQVFDSVGQPVPNAALTIVNTATTPPINLTRTTDNQGVWVEVGLPTSTASYHIVATKSGYSSDQTYPSTGGNPNPAKPDSTVAGGAVTGISFSIDHTSALTLQTVDQSCQPISGVGLNLRGSKLVGTPNVIKFSGSYTTDPTGLVSLNPLEWDNYTPTVSTPSYMVYGSSPIQQINLLPGTTQLATLILGPATQNSLLVIVKDASTGNPIEGASVALSDASLGFTANKFTAGSVLYQQDWSGGAGQGNMLAANKYYQDDGNIDTAALPTGVRLKTVGGVYVPTGSLISSTFDTGTASTSYTTLTWNPTSQSASTSLSFQIATNNDNATWNFLGPDGTAATYYTTPGTMLSTAHNNMRYLRYQAFLGTTATSATPVLSNVTVNYVAGCFAPGQAMFAGLTGDTGYSLTVGMSGYQTQTISSISINGNNVLQVGLSQ